ncbi:thiamine pyrophosphate-binding protein [Haematospirillum sp. H1815]|uniref:thiamine pyrophosphate-binding protein n=1 Tax=Haematospirillum sp. H1815 TaxID=2723108 RepID=UPI002474FA69|nr:thiamine pyrophosphate-binding protein [Haematospirillum sp. H1815]
MRVADYIMSRIEQAGVDRIFTVTGRGSLFLTDALARNSALGAVCVHHEQSAAFAAIAYAAQTHGIGVCLVSTGCASTNVITGVLSAWQDQIPLVVISGQHYLQETTRYTGKKIRTFGQQEADIVSIVSPITQYAHMVSTKDEIVHVMDEALSCAYMGRKGPVWIDVPLDVQSARLDLGVQDVTAFKVPELPRASDKDIETLLGLLRSSKRPVILLGSGVKSSGAQEDFINFVRAWSLPVTYAASAPDTYGSAHDLSLGSVGMMGCSRAGNFAVQNSDLLLVLGCRLTSLTTGTDVCSFARAAKKVVVDIDLHEHRKNDIRIDHLVCSDVAYLLRRLNEAQPSVTDQAWLAKCQHWKKVFSPVEPHFKDDKAIDLYELADCLSTALPRPSTLVTDSGFIEVILPTNIRFPEGINCIHPVSQGAMGFALPAAIGAFYGKPQTVVAVVGDGSIMMNLQELEVIRYHQIPLKIIVVSNNAYSIIRRRQSGLFRGRTIGTGLDDGVSCPDFSKVAVCFGMDYMRIDHPGDLQDQLNRLMGYQGPVVCEIAGRMDQEYIEVGYAKDPVSGRLVRRPLEDQSPFLDRSIFFSEMVVDPVD